MMKHDKSPQCYKCKKTFPSRKVLDEHTKKVQSNKLHECVECEAKFIAEHALKQHTKSVHKNTGRKACDKFQKSFENMKDLGDHKEASHVANLFECAGCEAMFTTEEALTKHTRTIHKDIPTSQKSDTFKCRMCGKGCKSGSDLDNHIVQCARNALSPNSPQANKKNTNNDICWRGSGCSFLRAGNCHYFHPVRGQGRRQEQEQEPCRRGPRCSFMAAGACNFFHPGVRVQQPRRRQGGWRETQGAQGGWKENQGARGGCQEHNDREQPTLRRQEGGQKQNACRYQEDCYKVPSVTIRRIFLN